MLRNRLKPRGVASLLRSGGAFRVAQHTLRLMTDDYGGAIVSRQATPQPAIAVRNATLQKILPYSIAFAFGLALVMTIAIDFAPH